MARRVLALTHLAFWAEAGSGRVPGLLRGVVAPLGAPAIPVVMGRRRLVAEVVRCVSQLHMGYPAEPDLARQSTLDAFGAEHRAVAA